MKERQLYLHLLLSLFLLPICSSCAERTPLWKREMPSGYTGIWKAYEFDSTNVSSVGSFRNGKRHGVTKWFVDGKVIGKCEFREGLPWNGEDRSGIWQMSPPEYRDGVRLITIPMPLPIPPEKGTVRPSWDEEPPPKYTGLWQTFYDGIEVYSQCMYLDGKRQGVMRWWAPDGTFKGECEFFNGQPWNGYNLSGIDMAFYLNGKPLSPDEAFKIIHPDVSQGAPAPPAFSPGTDGGE